MKKLLFVVCLAIIAAGCKKGSQITTHINNHLINTSLFAKWELRSTSGGLQLSVYFAPGNGDMIQFNADSTYIFYTGGTISKQGSFQIKELTSLTEPEKFKYIYYDSSVTGDILVMRNDSLTIGTSAADGLESLYIKK